MLRRLSIGAIVAGAVVSALFATAVLTPSTAHAAGAVGNGGAPGGGGADSVHANYGYGWYQFTVDSATRPRNGAFGPDWATTNATCKSVGARSIIAFVVYRPSGGLNNSVNLNYEGWPDNWVGAQGNNGHPWMTAGQAKARYDSVDADKSGYTWGVNVGWFCYDFSMNWTINGQSYIEKGAVANKSRSTKGPITASVGETLNWYHDMRNTGTDAMERQINYVVDKTGFTGSWNNNQPTGWASGAAGSLFVQFYATNNAPYTRYVVTQNDVGKSLCQRIAWRDAAWNAVGQWGRADFVCANVPYNYSLTPTMTINPSTVIEPGEDQVAVDVMMRNAGSTKSRQVSSMTTRLVIPRGTSLPSAVTTSSYTGSDITQAACAHFNVPGRKACDVQTRNVVGHVFPPNSNTQFPGGRYDDNIAGLNLEVGDRLCYVASVNQYAANIPASGWRHSAVRCLEVAKSPKVQIKGGNLYAGRSQPGTTTAGSGDVTTSINTKKVEGTNRVFGSWIEYGIFATGAVDAASGAMLAGENGADIAMQALKARNPLTFENRTAVGQFGAVGAQPNLRAQFSAPARACGNPSLASMNAGIYNCTNAVTLNGQIPIGKSVVIQAPRIVIDGDIRYAPGQVTSLKDMPQLVLISNDIVINSNVRSIDAWLIADSRAGTANGWIVTCPDARTGTWSSANYTAGLSDSTCANQLQVNGPIMANKLFLRRTAGSGGGADSNSPAEIFNMRADAYLWAQQFGGDGTTIKATYTRDLAPRF